MGEKEKNERKKRKGKREKRLGKKRRIQAGWKNREQGRLEGLAKGGGIRKGKWNGGGERIWKREHKE